MHRRVVPRLKRKIKIPRTQWRWCTIGPTVNGRGIISVLKWQRQREVAMRRFCSRTKMEFFLSRAKRTSLVSSTKGPGSVRGGKSVYRQGSKKKDGKQEEHDKRSLARASTIVNNDEVLASVSCNTETTAFSFRFFIPTAYAVWLWILLAQTLA